MITTTAKSVLLCSRCKGTGYVEERQCDEGGGNNGADYWYNETVMCVSCEGNGLILETVTTTHEPFDPSLSRKLFRNL